MRSSLRVVLAFTAVFGLQASTAAQEEPTKPRLDSARTYLELTCRHLASTNPRVRYSAREALRHFPGQASVLIKEAKAKAEDPHVRAFMDRTLARVRVPLMSDVGKKDAAARRKRQAALRNRPPYDIDRIAMNINLTFEQIAKLDPMLRRHFKEMNALWREMRDAGATKDKDAYKELNAEIRQMAQDAEPKLRVFLDVRQTRYVVKLMSQFRYGGKSSGTSDFGGDLRAREQDLTERWEALTEEWRAFKEEAYGQGGGGKGGGK